MDIKINWQDKGEWKPFDLQDINRMPRTHAIHLFSNKTPVIAKEGETYITNSKMMLKRYKQAGKKAMLFADLQPSSEQLQRVGFMGGQCTRQ